MNFSPPPELADLQLAVRRMATDKIAPRARQIDETGEYPDDVFAAFRDMGLLGLTLPERYGGSAASYLGLVLAAEEVAKHSNVTALMLLLTRLPAGPLLIGGTEDQRQRYLPGIADGSQRAAFALSEAGAGSDVMGMTTRATRDGDDWILDGTKCWISGVRQADWYTVFAKVDGPANRDHGGLRGFIVERGWDGVEVGRIDQKMGVRGLDTGELVLSGVRVPDANRIGTEADAFRTLMHSLNSMRPVVAARGLGLAEGALMYAVEYAKQRVAFGRTISQFQGLQWELANAAADIEAARLLTYRAAEMVEAGQVGKQAVPFLSMAKLRASELAVRVSGLAVQVLGAAGYMKEHPTELWYRDAKQLTIVEGTSQVQLDLVARGLLDGDLWWG